MPSQSDRPNWLGAPLIVHCCPNCKQMFDSPSVCMQDGSETIPMVRPIKLVLWKNLKPGEPMGVGYDNEDADAVISVDFENGTATIYPVVSEGEGGYSSSGPPRTVGLELVVVAERRGSNG